MDVDLERDVVELCERTGRPKLGSDLVGGHGAGQPVIEDAHLKEEKKKRDISGHAQWEATWEPSINIL